MVSASKPGVLVNIYFDHFQGRFVLSRQSLHCRCYHPARSTPGCPEIHEYGSIRLQYFALERGFSDSERTFTSLLSGERSGTFCGAWSRSRSFADEMGKV